MATTIKALIRPTELKKDGTYNLKLRVTHNRKTTYISTPIFIPKDYIRKDTTIKNPHYDNAANDLVKRSRDAVHAHGFLIESMESSDVIDIIKKALTAKNEVSTKFSLDICQYSLDYCEGRPEGTRQSYLNMISAIKRYTGESTFDINNITYNWLLGFAQFINKAPIKLSATRSTHLYTCLLKAMHKRAKLQYNDEDNGVINIPLSPFTKFTLPKEKSTEKSIYLSSDQVRLLINQDLKGREEFSRDVYILSLLLAGMNTADLYTISEIKNNRIKYYRQKTKNRRKDNAEIHILICAHAKELLKKYADPDGKRIFNFYKKYSSIKIFRENVTRSLKEIQVRLKKENKWELTNLNIYSARHTFASIAVNEVKIHEYTIQKALNHVDKEMKVTEGYIQKDWSSIDNAILAVEEHIFNPKPKS